MRLQDWLLSRGAAGMGYIAEEEESWASANLLEREFRHAARDPWIWSHIDLQLSLARYKHMHAIDP